MALSGPQALRKLDKAIDKIRREEQDISRRLALSNKKVAQFKQKESVLIRQLIELQLDAKSRKELGSQLFGAEKRAHRVLEAHEAQLQRLENQLKELDEKIALEAKNHQALLEKIKKAQNELNVLSKKIIAELEKDLTYQKAKEKYEKLAEIAQRSLEKTELAEKTREEKGQPYRDDDLFIYLWNKKYGTKDYKASNLIRWLDGKVASLIGYNQARPNFAMLNEIPIRLREHAQYQQELAQKALDKVELIEKRAIDKAGGKRVRKILEQSQAKSEELTKLMAKLEDERDEIAQKYNLLAEGRSPELEKAIIQLEKIMQAQNIRLLFERSTITSIKDDDNLVKKIENIRKAIKEEEPDIRSYRERLRILGQRRRELEDIEWEFKRARFDDPLSSFSRNDLAGSLLKEFLSGAISAAIYWQQWQNSQTWRSGADWDSSFMPRKRGRSRKSRSFDVKSPWSSSFGRYSSSRSSDFSSFSRPRRSGSYGSRKNKGFKTGGGF